MSESTQSNNVEEDFCNPEPPPELLHSEFLMADNIGDTVFSKHWLFGVLMDLISTVEGCTGQDLQKFEDVGYSKGSPKQDVPSEDTSLNIDEALQNKLCQLWDMSMSSEVAMFLCQFKAIDIFLQVIQLSQAPRVREICIGILGNMACHPPICGILGESSGVVLSQLSSTDAPTLVELTRLLLVCVSSNSQPWLTAISQEPAAFTHLSFILQSSTNHQLLQSTAQLLYALLYQSDNILRLWSSGELVLGLLEAQKEMGDKVDDSVLHSLQLLSTTEAGVEALLCYATDVHRLCQKYLQFVCSEEVVSLGDREQSLASAISLLTALLPAWEDGPRLLMEEHDLVRLILKILAEVMHVLDPHTVKLLRSISHEGQQRGHRVHSHEAVEVSSGINHDKEATNDHPKDTHENVPIHPNEVGACDNSGGGDGKECSGREITETAGTSFETAFEKMDTNVEDTYGSSHERSQALLKTLYEVIQGCLVEIISLLLKLGKLGGQGEMGCPEAIDYLDTRCPKHRLLMMLTALNSSQQPESVQFLTTLAEAYKAEALLETIQQFSANFNQL